MTEHAIYPGDMDMGPPLREVLMDVRNRTVERVQQVAAFAGNVLLRGGEEDKQEPPPEYKENEGGVYTDASSGTFGDSDKEE